MSLAPRVGRIVEVLEGRGAPFLPGRRFARLVLALRGISLVAALILAAQMTRQVRKAPPAELPAEGAEPALGMPESERRALFTDMVAGEPAAVAAAQKEFPSDVWSQWDDRAATESQMVRKRARAMGLTPSQLYLILDEGIRAQWPGPDGKPLDARVVPLKPRPR